MNDQLLTLSKIFTERLFRIPDYQRGYAWTHKQLKDFWNDLDQLDELHTHYTGVLTLETVPIQTYKLWEDDYWIIDAKNYQPFFVVDGQQRMTTVIILIQVLLERLNSGDKLNFTSREDIQRRFIYDSKDDGISRSYIFGYEKDNPSYEFLKTRIFCERSSTALGQETVYTQNLAYAKQFFTERTVEFSHEQMKTLYRKVTQQLLFNIFTITEDVDVCVAFETMNNRGKPLSYLELLKNRLIYLSLKIDAPDSERRKLRREINECWKAIYHNLGRNKERPLEDDRFLSTHYLIYFREHYEEGAEPPETQTLRYLRRFHQGAYVSDLLENRFVPKNVTADAPADTRITVSDIYQYVSSLQESVVAWYKIWNPFDSDLDADTKAWLDKINRLNLSYFAPLLLVYLQSVESVASRLAFLQALERLLFISMLSTHGRAYPDLVDPATVNLAIALRIGKTTPEKVTKHISDQAARIIKDPTFISDRFRSAGFYQWPGIRYFLFEYNIHLHSRSKTDRPKIFWPEFTERRSDFVSVEHIYPQYARDVYWSSRFNHLPIRQRAALRESLGNLLPLSKQKNSSLSNRPFPSKVDGNPDMAVGYRYGCYAENEVAKVKEWTPEEILKRGLRMLDFMEQRWGVELGDEGQKKKMLGLEFMK